MKKLLLLLSGMCWLAGGARAEEQELLKNLDFEQEAEGWTLSGGATVVPEARHRGKAGLRIVDFGSVRSALVPVKPGQKVRVEFWGRRTSEKAVVVVTLNFFSESRKWTTDVDEKLRSTVVTGPSNSWVKHKLEALIPDHVDTVAVWIHSWSKAVGSGDVDDFSVTVK